VVVGAGHPFSGGLSEAFTAECVAVLVRCTALGVAVMPHGQKPRIKSLSGTGLPGFAGIRSAAQAGCAYLGERDRTTMNCNPECNPWLTPRPRVILSLRDRVPGIGAEQLHALLLGVAQQLIGGCLLLAPCRRQELVVLIVVIIDVSRRET
jgi:hypothetical protein